MKKIVLSLGGSVLLRKDNDTYFLRNLSKMLLDISTKYQLYIVIGGGVTARTYITRGRTLGLHEIKLDELGIAITRVNAQFFSMTLGLPSTSVPNTTEEAAHRKESLVIMGGTTPGHSTDMVGAELAQKLQAERFVIATDVTGVYDKDPNTNKDAKLFNTISIDTLIKTYGTSWETAGKNTVIDGPALKIIQQAKIPTYVVNGLVLPQLKKALLGEPFEGTSIQV